MCLNKKYKKQDMLDLFYNQIMHVLFIRVGFMLFSQMKLFVLLENTRFIYIKKIKSIIMIKEQIK
jgi:hypothetical protein